MNDRAERFSKITIWLDGCYSQKPSPDKILNQMLVEEQKLNLRLTNSQAPFNLVSTTITTVVGQDTYDIPSPLMNYQTAGKVHFVIRTTGQPTMPNLPVQFDDFAQLHYGQMPSAGIVNPLLWVPERISFYRSEIQNQTIRAVVQPVPQEVLTYTVWFFAGALDRSQAALSGTGPVSELSDYLDMKATVMLLPYAEWRDDDAFNSNKRKELAAGLTLQIAEMEPIVATYIRNVNAPTDFSLGHWDDDDY